MKRRVLFLLHFPPPMHGSSMMGQYIKKSKIINEKFICNYINIGTSSSIKNIGEIKLRKIIMIYKSIILEIKMILFYRPNIIYIAINSRGIGFYRDSIYAIIAKLFKIKILYHLHNKGIKKNQNKFIDNLLYRYIFKNQKAILLSKSQYSDIKKYISEDNVYYCHNGIPDIDLNCKNVSKKSRNSNIIQILFLSNLLKSKGILDLIKACQILVEKKINFRCNLVGAEGDIKKNEIEELIKVYRIENNVKYIGEKYEKNKIIEYINADIFIFPSLNETFGLVILEAMQFGIPIVATNEGAIPEIIKNNISGYIVSKNCSKMIAEKLEILIKNRQLRVKMGLESRKRYENMFTLEIFENNICKIINDMLMQ